MTKFALITGASSGIGKALAHEFAKDNYHLVAVAEQKAELEDAVEQFSAVRPGIHVYPITRDLTREESAQEIYDELQSKQITIDVLVNDAGVGERGEFAFTPLEKELYILRLNIEALTRLTKLFLPDMLTRGEGGILNVGSIAGFQPGPLLAVYHASKAYVNSLSEALAEELQGSGVTVTCLCPGATDTNFFERAHMVDTRIVQKGKLMSPEDVAKSGYQAFKRGDRIFVPGAANRVLTFMRRIMPESMQAKVSKKFYEVVEEASH